MDGTSASSWTVPVASPMNLVTLATLAASILAGIPSPAAAQGMVGGRVVSTTPGFRYEGPLPAIQYLDIADDAGLAFRHVAASPARTNNLRMTFCGRPSTFNRFAC